MIDSISVGKKITKLRRSLDLSQEELANKLYITRQCLSKWEIGLSVPNIDTILDLTKIFNVSIDELLCLDEKLIIDEENIFVGHERLFIVKKLINNELDVSIPNIFYQLSPSERMLVIRNIKDGITKCDIEELKTRLTLSELKFLGGNVYEIEKSNN